jgi:hypothetical protein
MRRYLWILLALALTGCAGNSVERRNSAIAKDAELARRQAEIGRLQALVEQQQAELKAKDAEIQDLRKRLNNFGVF